MLGEHTHEYRTVQLPGGRQLGYSEYGDLEGSPVLFFHGMPGSSYIHADIAEIAVRRSIRLIAVDRPGYGLSTPQPDRTLLSWADDIEVLTDVLGLQQFSIIGFSGGSPYALACANKFPHRIAKVALAGAFAPFDAPDVTADLSPSSAGLYALAQSNTEELKKIISSITESPAMLLGAMSASLPEWDKDQASKRMSEFEAEYTRTLRTGIDGIVSDFVLVSRGWGFALDSIRTEAHLWSGTCDGNTPPAMTHYLAEQLPSAISFILPGEGHLSLYVHWEEILERLVSR